MAADFDTTRIEQMLRPMDLGSVPDFGDKHPSEIFKEFNGGVDKAVRNGGPRELGGISVDIAVRDLEPAEYEGYGREFAVERRLRVAVPVPRDALTQVLQFTALDLGKGLTDTSIATKKLGLSAGIGRIPELPLIEALGLEEGVDDDFKPQEEGLLLRSLVSLSQAQPPFRTAEDPEDGVHWVYGGPGLVQRALKPTFGIATAVLEKATVL